MLFAVEELESEICKLRGLLQMLHEYWRTYSNSMSAA